MAKTYQKRPGTTNKGHEYESLNIANLVIKLVSDERIKNFEISSNDNDFGAFDDIVVELEYENRSEILALQLKHKSKSTLSTAQLANKDGDFSVRKYFHSVQSIKRKAQKYILYTNLKLENKDNVSFQLEGEGVHVKLLKCDSREAFLVSDEMSSYYKFQIVEDSCTCQLENVVKYKSFFDSFYLYANQENADSLKRNIVQRFNELFSASQNEIDRLLKIISEWCQREGKIEKLNRRWMQRSIALQILYPHIKPLAFTTVNEKSKILQSAILEFDIAVFAEKSYDQVKELWGDANCKLDERKKKYLIQKYQLVPSSSDAPVDDKDFSILLWLMGKAPLILQQSKGVYKAIELCRGEKFNSAFQTLNDLKTKTSQYERLVLNFTLTLQGKEEICLKNLIKNDADVLDVLKTDDLLEMSIGQCRVGEAKEILSVPYVERCVLKNAIDIKVLDNVPQDTAIILDCVPPKEELKNRFKKHHFIDINDRLNEEGNSNGDGPSFDQKSHAAFSSSSTTIYVRDKPCEYRDFDAVCHKTKNGKHFHQFRVRHDGHLEWVRSRGDANYVEQFTLSEYYPVQERNLSSLKSENQINLLVSDPGMGKSELMRSFKQKCFSESLTVIIDPKDIHAFFENRPDTANYVKAFQNFLLDEKYKMLSDRDKSIFRIFFKTNSIIFVWDALDELSYEHQTIVTDMIVDLSEKCVQWVTSRGHLRNMLQSKFSVLALTLSKFDEKEQRNYIEERLSSTSPLTEIQTIVEKIESSFVLVEHKDILGVPLQLFMLTELFRQDREKYLALLDNFFLLTDLYRYFIEEKFKIHYKDKLGIDLNTAGAEILIQSQRDTMFEEYTNAALRFLFSDAILTKLMVHYKGNFEEIHKHHKNIGLVTSIDDQIPRFLHNSFAEYLAARYFANKLAPKEILIQVMFDPKYVNIRFFFDLLLSGDSRAHVAILYQNFSFLKSCTSEFLKRTDRGGRSVLHLACSWGQKFPELKVERIGRKYIVDDRMGFFKFFRPVSKSNEYFELIDCLSEKCEISATDEIYEMTPGEYARKATCLTAEMRILMKQKTGRSIIENKHIINMLYYSAFHGCYHEFVFFFGFFEKNLVERRRVKRKLSHKVANNITDIFGMTLLSIAAGVGNTDIVEFLVQKSADMNLPDTSLHTPLFVACMHGRYNTVEFLVKAGAEINCIDRFGVTSLGVSSEMGYYEIVEFLVKAGADINLAQGGNFTPLFVASQNGHYDIVKLLVKAGAKINLAQYQSSTPLSMASERGHYKIVKFLVKAGADIHLPNEGGCTPLYMACCFGNYKIVKFLFERGASIHRAQKLGFTPLGIACENKHYSTIEFLVKAGAVINLKPQEAYYMPLSIASYHGHDKVVEFLVKNGADINLANCNGFTPLFSACFNGHYNIVKFLINAGSKDVNLAQKSGETPLFIAALFGYYEIVEYLFKAGANVNQTNEKGFTPLYIASQNGHEKVVKFLVQVGADIHHSSRAGTTSFGIACLMGHYNIVEFLLKAGTDINHANK